MSELPEGWVRLPLRDLIDPNGLIADGDWVESKDQDVNGDIRLLQLADVGDGVFLDRSTRYVNEDAFRRLRCTELRPGDVLVARMPDPLGRACITPNLSQRAITVVDVAIVRPANPAISTAWLKNFLNSPEIRREMELLASGTTRRRISRSKLEGIEIPVPPPLEQIRIAGRLESLFAQLSECRTRLKRASEILKRFREAVLEAAVSGRLTQEWRSLNPTLIDATKDADKVRKYHDDAGGHAKGNAAPPSNNVHDLEQSMFPEGWALVELRDLVDPDRPITYGILKPGDNLRAGVRYVRVADYPDNGLNISTIRRTSPAIDQQFARSRLRDGDLLLSIRGTVGRVIEVPKELEGANITQDSARLSIQRSVDRRYVLWFLRSRVAQLRMQRAIKGVAVRGINIGDVRALQIPLPSRDEQREIVRRTEELVAIANSLERQILGALSRVSRLGPSILSKAFQGRLIPQDPGDEPVAAARNMLGVREGQLDSGKPIPHRRGSTGVARKPKRRQPAHGQGEIRATRKARVRI